MLDVPCGRESWRTERKRENLNSYEVQRMMMEMSKLWKREDMEPCPQPLACPSPPLPCPCLTPHHQSLPAPSSARVAQEEWALTTFAERKRVLACLQRYILDNQDDIARVASRDSGKPGKQAPNHTTPPALRCHGHLSDDLAKSCFCFGFGFLC